MYSFPKRLLLIQIAFFLLLSGSFLILSKPLSAQVKDPNLQIEPSPTPRPACFTPWSSAVESGGGIDESACDEFWNNHRATNPFATKKYVNYENTPHCNFFIEIRSPAICPPFNDAVKFSVDKERPKENGEFTITWSSNNVSNPDAKCTLSGKAPEKGNFSEDTRDGKRTYTFVQRGIYPFQFSCEGILNNSKSLGRGVITRNITVFVGNIPPAPIVNLKAEPAVIKKGESATLNWTSENVLSLSLNQGIGVVPRSGSLKVSPSLTTRYTLTGSGEFAELGLARHSVTVRVLPPEAPPEAPPIEIPPDVAPSPPKVEEKPKIDLKVNGQDGPVTMGAPASFTLSWNLDKYCLAYGSWIGVKTKAGSEKRTETKSGTYTYKVYCPTVGSDEVTVKVTGGAAAIPLPVAEASASLDGKNFSQSIRVTRGVKTNLWLGAAYDINGDKKVSRDETGRWTRLMSESGQCLWNTDLNQGDPTFDGAVADPETPESCTIALQNITFFDKPGVYRYGVLRLMQNDVKLSNIGYINVAVQEPPPPDGPPVIDFRINNLEGPNVTLGAPADYILSWNVRNADICSASDSWSGEKFSSGSQRFVSSEKKEFTYTLNCVGKLGTTKKSVSLKVTELPVCDFSALPLALSKSVFDRQSVLSWKCQFANSCEISPMVGKVNTFGSVRVSPKNTTPYTLTCQNLEGSSSFDQLIEVK